MLVDSSHWTNLMPKMSIKHKINGFFLPNSIKTCLVRRWFLNQPHKIEEKCQ